MRRVMVTLVAVLCMSVGPTAAVTGNEVPLADAGLDQTVELGTTVVLDATGSRDPDGSITSYRWTIETPRGHMITPAEPTQPRTTFQVTETGRYRVSVVIRDEDGASTKDTLYVTVNNNIGSEPTEDPSDSLSNDSSRETPDPDSRTDTGDSDTEDTVTVFDDGTEETRDDEIDTETGTEPPIRREGTTVEVVRYVAEDIDFETGTGLRAVNNNKLPGVGGSKNVDYSSIDLLKNAGNVFQQGFEELIFGRERQSYSFTTTNRSEAIYNNSSKRDMNGYELDMFSNGPAVGLNKEYVDFRRVSDKPIEDADVYRVYVVVLGEKGIVDYIEGGGELRKDDTVTIDNVIDSTIEDLTHDYSSKTNDDSFADNENSTRTRSSEKSDSIDGR
jgi:hypothetical protein